MANEQKEKEKREGIPLLCSRCFKKIPSVSIRQATGVA